MAFPMIGAWTVVVNAIRPFAIHGDPYFELRVTRDDDQTDHLLRVSQHSVNGPIAPPQRVVLTFLMGQVTDVKAAV